MTTTLSSKGQVVLPSTTRRRLGLKPGDKFSCAVRGGEIVLTPTTVALRKPRLRKSKLTGLVYAEAVPGAPKVSSAQIRSLLADFP
jgi:AbrB family looped-hinge helix DNA binding protein